MERLISQALRPICSQVNKAIGQMPNGAFNFGLYFQKWFHISTDTWKCATDHKKPKGSTELDLRDNMEISINLFNQQKITVKGATGQWNYKEAQVALKARHDAMEKCAAAFKKLGYEYLKREFPLITPLVIGLGNEHPTEKGFRFDWTLGIPSIPASSIKGVVRLAYLVNELNKCQSHQEAEAFCKALLKGELPERVIHLFGFTKEKEKEAWRGKVIFFDAYPAVLPRLKPEIMNCHYPEYFKGERGPTEDQSPNPQKFWAIDPKDKDDKPLKFVFRFLLHKDLAGQKDYRSSLEEALKSALEEHGLGAKTAIGHGRFSEFVSAPPEPADMGKAPDITPPPASEIREVWEKAHLTWNPANQTLTASCEGKKATCKGKELVPAAFHRRLFDQRKLVTARVEVEPIGNAFRIVKVEEGA